MKSPWIVSAVAFAMSLSAQGQTGAAPSARYVGTDGNWFNPANWSTGRVPGANEDVLIDGRSQVVIDGALGLGTVQVRDLTLRGSSRLSALNRAIVETRSTTLQESATSHFSASAETGDALVVAPFSDPEGCTDCAINLNPNPKTQRAIVLQSSVTLDVGLGGSEPAALTKTGAGRLVLASGQGYYSTVTADTLVLDGQLRLSLYYGFEPRAGQSFQVFTAQTRSGQFLGLPEGGLVGCTEDGLGFYISYRGGDGNDVVLSTANTPPQSCLLLPAIQKVREAARRSQSTAQSLGAVVTKPAGLLLPAVQKVREAAR